MAGVDAPRGRFVAWTDDATNGGRGDGPSIESLIVSGNPCSAAWRPTAPARS